MRIFYVPFFLLRFPLVVALSMALLVLDLVAASMETPRSGPQAERALVREREEADRRQEILRQCLGEGREDKGRATAVLSAAAKTSLAWRAVVPSDGLMPPEPLTRLADDVIATLAWADTKPEDAAYEGLVALLASPARYLGLVPAEESREYFLQRAFGELGCSSSWKEKDGFGICLREAVVQGPAGETKAVQGVAVTIMFDMPVFWFVRRLSRGDMGQETEDVEAALQARFDSLAMRFWEKHGLAEIARAFCNPVLLLPALLLGWCFALEYGFALLSAVLLSGVWTLLSLSLELAGFAVSVARPFWLAAAANSLVAVTVVLLGGVLRRKVFGEVLEDRLRTCESELAARFAQERDRAQSERQKRHVEKLLDLVQDRSRRNRRYLLTTIVLLAWVLLVGVRQQEAWESGRSFSGTQHAVEALARHPGR